MLSGLLPDFCVVCAEPGVLVCPTCFPKLSPIQTGCPRCGRPLDLAAANHACGECLLDSPVYDRHTSLFVFNETVAQLVHHFKYDAAFWVKRLFARSLAQLSLALSCDVVLPVPLHPHKLATRGYNQAWELAKVASQYLKCPAYADGLLRTKETPTQTRLDRRERQANLNGAFAVSRAELLRDKVVLLVDDVHTTGATLMAAAKVCQAAGARRVEALTLAMVP